jgi:hypothetical protein
VASGSGCRERPAPVRAASRHRSSRPEELWARFDAAVASLNRAITGSDAAQVADAFGEMAEAANALAAAVVAEDEAGQRAGTTPARARGAA